MAAKLTPVLAFAALLLAATPTPVPCGHVYMTIVAHGRQYDLTMDCSTGKQIVAPHPTPYSSPSPTASST